MDGKLLCVCGVRYFPKLLWKHRLVCSGVVVHTVANEVDHVVANEVPQVANRSGDRHRDKAARRVYMRDLMRKRRQRGSEEKGSG